jgi:CheY-like chemotaxis protein
MTNSITERNIVFYADDDLDDLELVRDAFAQYSTNVEVLTATDGGKALSYLSNLKKYDVLPCLIILDVNMPVINGKETLLRLREIEHYQNVPIVLFTTSSQPIDKNFARKYNAGFITKPIDVKQMEIIADQFIEHCSEEVRNKIKNKIKE